MSIHGEHKSLVIVDINETHNTTEKYEQEKDTLDNERKNNVVLHVIISILECCLCLRE